VLLSVCLLCWYLVTGYCNAELCISFLAIAITIASTHVAPQKGMARLSWPVWLVQVPRQYAHEQSPISALAQLAGVSK